jgi:hypothetical protein
MRKLVVLMTLLLATAAVRGQLRICGSCGREDSAGGEFCTACQARLPDIPPPPAPADNAAEGQEPSPAATLAAGAFEQARLDVLAARGEESRRPEVALALYGNARALLAVIDPTNLPPATGQSVLEGLQRCRVALAVTAPPAVAPDAGRSSSSNWQAAAPKPPHGRRVPPAPPAAAGEPSPARGTSRLRGC